MDPRLISFLSMQIFTVPLLAVCAVGVVIGLSRSKLGTSARAGAAGFALLLLAQLLTMLQNYLTVYRYEGDYRQMATMSALFAVARIGLELAGLVALILAAFHREKRAA